METTEAFSGLRCLDCEAGFDADAGGRCPTCDGPLDVEISDPGPDREAIESAPGTGLTRYEALLPFPAETTVATSAGDTPLLSRPALADELGVEAVYVKDEGRNPTGALADRGAALAVTAAREQGATDVALPSMGNGGQAVAAAAAEAGLASHSFVPSRTPFVNKAMINVHGGDMTVVPGRYADAAAAYEEALAAEDWHPLAAFDTPYRQEGIKTLAYELLEGLSWSVPDAVVVPTGHGTGLVGVGKGFAEARRFGLIDAEPKLIATQASGCAPIVDAWESDAEDTTPVEHPDTICGPLEIPDPAGGSLLLDALERTRGAAVASDDDGILQAAVDCAESGLTASVSGGAALAGARSLAERGAFETDDVVVLVDPLSGNKEADLLRSHLMGQGV